MQTLRDINVERFLNESEELDKNLLDGDNIEFIENDNAKSKWIF